MRRRVNPARAAAHDRHANISELICQFARRFEAIMRGHSRADHGHGIFVLRRQRAFDVKRDRRIVNLPEQLRIFLVALNQRAAAGVRKAFQFTRQINGLLPMHNGFGGFVTDVANAEQGGF